MDDNFKKNITSFFRSPAVEFIFDLAKLVILAIIVVWPIHKFIMQPFIVLQSSMEPSFFERDYLIIDELSYRFVTPERGEVIVFVSPQENGDKLIKRVIGLPNEKISINNGEIIIFNKINPQGARLEESAYLSSGLTTKGEVSLQLKDDEYFVMGDNRSVSLDSRTFGSIKKKSIIGRALFRLYPFNRVVKFSPQIYSNL
ncbi:MAG: signal peptidase I [Patescibacteria group bacterium]